jgi:hypothetical protein
MIHTVQPLSVGNALRLFIQPPAGAARWKVLRNGSGVFAGHDDPSALVAYDGTEKVVVDIESLQNGTAAYYRPFYTSNNGASWLAGPVASGTPAATYEEQTTDVLVTLRARLEAGLKVECQRGHLINELGYIPVFTASPAMDHDLRLPLVTVHLESEDSGERGIGECIGSSFDDEEGWLSNVSVVVVGWSLNGDERAELRQAIRRIIIANFPVFEGMGWVLPHLAQQDVDAVGGEYPAPIYQVMNTFTCIAPVRVASVSSAGVINNTSLEIL